MIDIYELYRLQSRLDKIGFEASGETRNSTYNLRFLAMVIKIRELLNETQDFNYDKEKVLEELVDVLHSAISLSIDCLGIYEECYSKQKEALYCLINETNVLNESDFGSKLLYLVQNDTNKIQILSFISAIFGFGNYLGFSNLEIKDACKRKNKKKLSRIEKNY